MYSEAKPPDGSTLAQRFARHQAGYEKATKGRGPWELVHTEEYETQSEARKREHYLKHAPGAAREKAKWIAGTRASARTPRLGLQQ